VLEVALDVRTQLLTLSVSFFANARSTESQYGKHVTVWKNTKFNVYELSDW
jgi:hypothetical protein